MPELSAQIRHAKILIVDDNPDNLALIEGMLEAEGYSHVYSTQDPREVCKLYQEERFDLILLDINMPYMSGLEVMDELNRIIDGDYLPVLVLTAQTDNETRHRALERGAKDFLTKPFEYWEALHRIYNLLETRIYFNRQRLRADYLDAEVRQRTEEVRSLQLEIIRRLGRAAEFKDNETGMHVIRMSKSCQVLALAAGLSEEHAEMLLYASPMHDIGKIGIPDRILLKPGQLDEDEWKIMKQHAEMGCEIIGEHTSDLLRMACTIAHSHHERWDGSGYPRGLKGEEIPIDGRITAICDVFDALTSVRPYKKAWPAKDALAYINEQAGKHFDPTLVAAFNQAYPAILEIADQYADEKAFHAHSAL